MFSHSIKWDKTIANTFHDLETSNFSWPFTFTDFLPIFDRAKFYQDMEGRISFSLLRFNPTSTDVLILKTYNIIPLTTIQN